MWARYEPYCPDRHFLTEARTHFLDRTWEMRLACVLLDNGFTLLRTSSTGPDICIDGSPRIWIEATAASGGRGTDRVADRAARAFTEAERGYSDEELPGIDWHGRPPSEESVILRCTEALDRKSKAYEKYRSEGIIREDEAYIIALSLAGIEDAFYLFDYDGVPVVLQALFGIGAEHLVLPGLGGGNARLTRPPRPMVRKSVGAEIAVHAFASTTHLGISGFLGTCTDIVNAPLESGREIMFVNNPNARAPIEAGTFRFGMEFIASNGEIRRQDHRGERLPVREGPSIRIP